MRPLVHLLLAAAFMLLGGCSRNGGSRPTPASLHHDFPDQFARIDFYVQNFSRFLKKVPIHHEESNAVDPGLFLKPPFLNFELMDEKNHVVLNPPIWSRDRTVHHGFWMERDRKDDSPIVKTGSAITRSGRNVKIAHYESVMVEAATGRRVVCTVIFDLDELQALQAKRTAATAAAKPAP